MATLGTLHSFVPNTAAKATEVNENFNTIKAFVEAISTGVNIDSGVITTSKIATGAVTEEKIGAAAVSISKLASSALNLFTPIGSIVQYAASAEPAGWKLCNGQALSIATYPELYNLLTDSGTVFRFGANPTSGTFLLPNLKGRLPIGFDDTQTEFDVVGETGGAKVISEGNLPAHKHAAGTLAADSASTGITIPDSVAGVANGNHSHLIATDLLTSAVTHGHGGDGGKIAGGTSSTPAGTGSYTVGIDGQHGHQIVDPAHSHTISGSTANTGSGNVFLPPYLVVNYLIKVA